MIVASLVVMAKRASTFAPTAVSMHSATMGYLATAPADALAILLATNVTSATRCTTAMIANSNAQRVVRSAHVIQEEMELVCASVTTTLSAIGAKNVCQVGTALIAAKPVETAATTHLVRMASTAVDVSATRRGCVAQKGLMRAMTVFLITGETRACRAMRATAAIMVTASTALTALVSASAMTAGGISTAAKSAPCVLFMEPVTLDEMGQDDAYAIPAGLATSVTNVRRDSMGRLARRSALVSARE